MPGTFQEFLAVTLVFRIVATSHPAGTAHVPRDEWTDFDYMFTITDLQDSGRPGDLAWSGVLLAEFVDKFVIGRCPIHDEREPCVTCRAGSLAMGVTT